MNEYEKTKRLGIEEFVEWLDKTDRKIFCSMGGELLDLNSEALVETFFRVNYSEDSSMKNRVKRSQYTDLMMGER